MPAPNLEPDDILTLPDEGRGSYAYWTGEVQSAVDRINRFRSDWNTNLDFYRAKTLRIKPDHDTVVVPRDFENVEQKSSQLFFQVPDVHLTAKQKELATNIQTFQAVLNHYLSEDECDALALMNEVLFDALCPSGLMCSKIGYETFEQGTTQMQVGEQPAADQPPPMAPGAILGLTPPPPPVMEPIMEEVPNIVHARYFWSRLSPAQVLIPGDFRGSKYDRAPWLGYRFEEHPEVITTRYGIAKDDLPVRKGGVGDQLYLDSEPDLDKHRVSDKLVGIEIWYRTSLFDPAAAAHPEKLRLLVLLDGHDQPLVHKDSPYQQEGKDGQLLGMVGFPIHIGALRVLTDSAFPPSECTISRSQVEELSKSRTQMMLQRERSIPMRLADLSKLGGQAGLDKLKKNIFQGIIPLDTVDANSPPIVPVGLASYPRENFAFHEFVDRDLQGVWAMGDNQRGMSSDEKKTATEQAIVDKAANARLDKERRQALRFFIAGVRKLGAMIQIFGTQQEYVSILGPNKAQQLLQVSLDQLQGKFTYWARPDSAIRLDQAEARTQVLKLYEMLAKDPNVNRVELLYEICLQWNLDPSTVVVPQLPEKGPDPAAVSFRFAAQDLDPTLPSFELTIEILRQSGYKIEPAMVQAMQAKVAQQAAIMNMAGGVPMAPGAGQPAPGPGSPSPLQTDHPGSAPKAEHLNKHAADASGDRPGRKPMVQ